MNNEIQNIDRQCQHAVDVIKDAILKSQLRAVKLVNQEQLALYYGIGRYVSENTRNKNWGTGAIKTISKHLSTELPGLRGFGETNLKNMRMFYEAWSDLERNSSVATDELIQLTENEENAIRQLRLTNLNEFPIAAFFSISFTHHIAIINNAKDREERLFYIRYCTDYKLSVDNVADVIKKDLYHHQGQLPNNFVSAIPDYKQAFRAIKMFKDDYILDFINTEELGVRDEEVDERVIENSIVHNIKNFIMAFGKGFTYMGNQVHYDKLGQDHWVDLLFYNRDLKCLTVFELKKGSFKTAYLSQLSAYLRVLNDEERKEGENAPIGIILCKSVNHAYVEYIMQDFKQPMGVATYKTSAEIDPELLKVLPAKEDLMKILDDPNNQ